MKSPPADLDLALAHQALADQWGICADDLVYLPVGFGDHHWQASTSGERYFVTVRDLRLDGRSRDRRQALQQLDRTFQAVRRLNEVAQLVFIVPPIPTARGQLIVAVGDAFALSIYEWLDVEPAADADGTLAAELVARLHRTSRERPVEAVLEKFEIPHRSALADALANLHLPWREGPYGEPARAQLLTHREHVRSALHDYDLLVATAVGSKATWCLTHGEPSGGNLVRNQSGAYFLVDWESARLAPPARDLVHLPPSDQAAAIYAAITDDPPPSPDLLRLYRLWYALAETSVYLLQFRAPHTADANMTESWQNFLTFLPGAGHPEVTGCD
ncbi:MAG: phosphotransferase [Chloroflexi bacterium]|nr:phosphotransferase [Chloroflexota bacterium]MBV9895356.1 phosphotransferase [Chloroflexota bacterium]